jgi:hypothetical protein
LRGDVRSSSASDIEQRFYVRHARRILQDAGQPAVHEALLKMLKDDANPVHACGRCGRCMPRWVERS